MKFIDKVEKTFQEQLYRVDALPTAQRFLNGTLLETEYKKFLHETYRYVRETSPLLMRASRQMLRLGQDKEFAEILALKASQESSHELWALADAMALGDSKEAVIASPPSLAGNLYNAWNEFIVEGPAPIAFLGTAYTLERLSIERGAIAVSNLRAHSTIPGIQQALSFLEGHAYEDLSHTDLLEMKLEGIHSEQERELTIESVRMTGRFYEGLLRSLADDANMTL